MYENSIRRSGQRRWKSTYPFTLDLISRR